MKKLSPLALLVFFQTVSADFPDVDSTHPHLDAINYVQAQGIVSGNPDGSFAPEAQITRAAFTKIVVEANYSKELIANCGQGNTDFADVPEGAWFDSYVCVSVKKGLVGGYPDGSFKPANTINLAEASKIIAGTLEESNQTDATPWYKPYLLTLESYNALPEELSTPADPLTRGQMAELIYRVQNPDLNKSSHTYASITGMPEPTKEFLVLPTGNFDTWTPLAPSSGYNASHAEGSLGARAYNGSRTDIELLGAFSVLPDLEDGFFYEGWIVRTGENLDVTSTGELIPYQDGYVNHFIGTDQDYSEHTQYVITLEPRDNNPAPDKHVIEGVFRNPLAKIVSNTDHDPLLGNGELLIVEYTDYQCPYCKRLHDNTSEYLKELAANDEITYVVKDFPLEFHTEALWTHIAANTVYESAGAEAYFEFRDSVFAGTQQWAGKGEEEVKTFLSQLAADQGVADIDWEDESILNEISSDIQEGSDSGVNGTPSLIIGGKIVSGSLSLDQLKELIEETR